MDIPFIEVHLSNVYQRESFRHHSYFSDIARGCIVGLGSQGYEFALRALLRLPVIAGMQRALSQRRAKECTIPQTFEMALRLNIKANPSSLWNSSMLSLERVISSLGQKIKNLITGRVLDPTFKSGEKVGKPDIEEKDMQYLYKEGEHYACMDMVTYDQVVVDKDAVADQAKWLKENDNVSVLFWNGRAITLELKSMLS